MSRLARKHGAWLHVDGAFGLFARVSPRTAALADGVERADSVISDGHKWLNVPHDCGFAFVRDPALLTGVFSAAASYLPEDEVFAFRGPELSRRARSLAVWATLAAYGRNGYRAVVERSLDVATHVAREVEVADDLELLAPVPLNIVCFRYRPPGCPRQRSTSSTWPSAVLSSPTAASTSTRPAGQALSASGPPSSTGGRLPLTPT